MAMFIHQVRVKRFRRFIQFFLLLTTILWTSSAAAMDRFAALSMIESGNDDQARGRENEVSRYQIRREVWLQTTNAPISQATNAAIALGVAQSIAAKRCAAFEKKYGRPPTDFEFYVLWNAPEQIEHPSRAVRARAVRFANLVQKKE
jgi:hypothetical protein